MHFDSEDLKNLLTILSSKEWNVIITNRAPIFNIFSLFSRNSSIASSSLLTAILNAWNVLVEGLILDLFLLILFIISDKSSHVDIFFFPVFF